MPYIFFSANFVRKYDYVSQYHPSFPYMRFTGNFMNDVNKRGCSRIVTQLDKLPAEITTLYFVMSSYRTPNISKFPNLSFKLIDEAKPDEKLASYQITGESIRSQAIIMCCSARNHDQRWHLVEIGKLSGGNIEDYEPIKKCIAGLGI